MIRSLWVAALVALSAAAPASAQSIAAQDSFPLGSPASVLCTAQSGRAGSLLIDMFDRGYAILCRDAAAAVGHVYALRTGNGDPAARLAAGRASRVRCDQPGRDIIDGLGPVEVTSCRLLEDDVRYLVYVRRSARTVHIAEGLAGYDSALRLALRSIVADRAIPGEVEIALTGGGDPTAFARAQAGALDRQRALAEAYRRNNAGSFAESAEFFSVLTEGQTELAARAEALANQALQQSNLGRFTEADAMFAQAMSLAANDAIAARRYRNYFAMHLLNQGLFGEAAAELDRPMPGQEASGDLSQGVIDAATAARLSAESPGAQRLAGMDGLTPQDRARVLDGQARQLRGVILRQQGRAAEAEAAWTRALTELIAIRGGRIAATIWLRAQILGDLAGIAEAGGDRALAERRHREAIALLDINYPGSSALFSAKARLAGFLLRIGRGDEGAALFREVVAASSAANGAASPALSGALAPYFALLAARAADPAAVADMFTASQILRRPGVAQTQAVLARELSSGSDRAARLFRQSVSLTRDLERARVELGRLAGMAQGDATEARASELRAAIIRMGEEQAATQSQLAAFPRYRVIAGGPISLAELQRELRPGEVYYKLTVVEDSIYAVLATHETARAIRLTLSREELEGRVNALRASIQVRNRDGTVLTPPFNVSLARQLYDELFGPVRADIAAARHLIFEPDGAMLRLPPNILVMEQAGVDTYQARVAASSQTEYDFRGIAWLGRDRDVSTAVSARAFRDVRAAPPSRALRPYIGFGQNSPLVGVPRTLAGGARSFAEQRCSWPIAAWERPISPDELFAARQAIIARGGGSTGEIVTGAAFTDTAIRRREDLGDFRILHFATHGLVTAPRAGCTPIPALMTSFGDTASDGLLTFAEIFDLELDADVIVLSACDTAGQASRAATEEAGLTSGGDFALDGLVRAFVGAGSRLVVASHWPVPEAYDATQRLISGMFTASAGTGVASALRQAQRRLMDDADTSHPFYWAGFAVIGDGTTPVVRPTPASTNSTLR